VHDEAEGYFNIKSSGIYCNEFDQRLASNISANTAQQAKIDEAVFSM
jgi:hypothetical protein